MIKDLVLKNRSYRRYDQSHEVSWEILTGLVELAVFSPSAKNMQPLRYYLSNREETNRKIFDCLIWAVYLKNWDGPAEGERPSAYMVQVCDKKYLDHAMCDAGIAAQSMLLGAVEQGLGGCMFGSVDRGRLAGILNMSTDMHILHVIALGKPNENIILETIDQSGDIKYWRDKQGNHHVPKRSLQEMILNRQD